MQSSARPFYYLENFHDALGWLRGRYADLLREDEVGFIERMSELPRESAALLVRMIMRRGDLFRASKLRYAEIGPTDGALPALTELEWVDPNPPLSLQQLCALLRRDELQKVFSLRRPPKAFQHKAITRQLELDFNAEDSRPLDHWWRDAPDKVLHVRVAALCDRLRLMFFGNFHQDWSAFVLSDLGIQRYETVALESTSRAFQTREQIDQLQRLQNLREQLESDAPVEDLLAAIPPPLPDCDWIEGRRAKLLFRIGQHSEKALDLEHAIVAYSACGLPEARIRAIRVHERLGNASEAASLLSDAESHSATEFERQHAARIRPRLMRKLGLTPVKKAPLSTAATWPLVELTLAHPNAQRSDERANPATVSELTLANPNAQRSNARADAGAGSELALAHSNAQRTDERAGPASGSELALAHPSAQRSREHADTATASEAARFNARVEYVVRDHLQAPNTRVIYAENALINSLFGLLIWPAIFAPVAGAFFHPFQAAPIDLYEPDFRSRRTAELDACFAQLDSGAYRTAIITIFEQKSGIASPFVAWGFITHDLLELALNCIPATHLRALFYRLLADPRTNRSGLPDLIQFWPDEKRYRMIEVKGPGDRLQDNQIRWLKYCVANDIPVEVCNVSWI